MTSIPELFEAWRRAERASMAWHYETEQGRQANKAATEARDAYMRAKYGADWRRQCLPVPEAEG